MRVMRIVLLFVLLLSCTKKNTTNTLVTDLVESIKQDADGINVVTNSIELLEILPSTTNEGSNVYLVENALEQTTQSETMELKPKVPVVKEVKPVKIITKAKPVNYQKKNFKKKQTKRRSVSSSSRMANSYIKVGNDRSGISVSRNKAQKITVAVFTGGRSSFVDIYVYAIPVSSPLVRNKNTLVGYVKNTDVINKQVQFTKYWSGARADRRPFKRGSYNIYVQYYYKNNQGQVIGMAGRFWGGDSRRWIVKVL